jgi:uncharacterized protein YbjT (DUF2867 family)
MWYKSLRIVLAGGTGLIGSRLVTRLAHQHLSLIGRRANETAPNNISQLVGAVDAWPALLANVSADVAICALGTTMAKAGSQAAFAAIDYDAVLSFASAAKASGARQFLLVSSTGADAASSNFYLSIKGKAEVALAALNFDRLDLFRPGLLRGERGADRRMGERAAIWFSPIVDRLLPAKFDRYRSIAGDEVAAAMAATVGRRETGVHIHHNREMWAMLQSN